MDCSAAFEVGAPAAAEACIEDALSAIAHADSDDARASAVEVLGRFAPHAVPTVLAGAAHAHPLVAVEVEAALLALPEDVLGRHRDLLCQQLRIAPDAEVRRGAVRLLARIMDREALECVSAALRDQSDLVSDQAVHALEERLEEAVPYLLERMREAPWDPRVIRLLSRVEPGQAEITVVALERALANAKTEPERSMLLSALGELGSVTDRAVNPLANALSRPEPNLRYQGYFGLARAASRSTASSQALIACASDLGLEADARCLCTHALSGVHADLRPRARASARELASDAVPCVAVTAARALIYLGDEDLGVSLLIRQIERPASSERERAARALAEAGGGGPAGVRAFAGLLVDPAPATRRFGLVQLRRFDPVPIDLVPEVERLAQADPSSDVRAAAEAFLAHARSGD